MKTFTDQQITDAYTSAPREVREYLESGDEFVSIITELGRRFSLHIDQMGVVSGLVRNSLIGLLNPQEFLQELITAGIQDAQARQVMDEINKKIFLPLYEKMRSASTTPPAKSTTPRTNAPVPSYRTPTPPAQSVPGVAALPPKFAVPRPAISAAPVATPTTAFKPTPTQNIVAKPAPRPWQSPELDLPVGEEPSRVQAPQPPMWVVRKVPPPPTMAPRIMASAPLGAGRVPAPPASPVAGLPKGSGTPQGSIPPNLPGAMPSFSAVPAAPATFVPPKPTPPQPLRATPPVQTPLPPAQAKPYNVDPYREPLDLG